MKTCSRCGVSKETKDFHKNHTGKNGLMARCKVCILKYCSTRQTQSRNNKLRRVYGLTLEEYDKMFNLQHGLCAICGKQEESLNRWTKTPLNLAVDHNHETGEIRGLLCSSCNVGLGYFKDSIENLQRAIKYLK